MMLRILACAGAFALASCTIDTSKLQRPCETNADCKGEKICVRGLCVEAPSDGGMPDAGRVIPFPEMSGEKFAASGTIRTGRKQEMSGSKFRTTGRAAMGAAGGQLSSQKFEATGKIKATTTKR